MKAKIIIIVMSALILLAHQGTLAQSRGMLPATVEVAAVKKQELAPTRQIPGNVISQQFGWLSAETTGKINSISPRGKKVKKGEIVAIVNTATLRSLRREQQSLIKAQGAQIGYLRNQLQRLTELRSQNIAAVSQLEETQANLDAALNNKAAAESRLEQVNIGIAASSIRAQFDGTITEHNVQLGELVSSGKEVIRIVDLSKKQILSLTSIDNISSLNVGDTVKAKTKSASNTATLTSSVPFGDIAEGVYELRFALDNDAFKLGQNVRLDIPQTEGNTVLTVPRDAIILRSDGSSVYKVNADNTTTRIAVTTGIGNEDSLAIIDSSGELQADDQVIIRGAERLRPGQTITIKQ